MRRLGDYLYLKKQHQWYIDELEFVREQKLGLTRILTGMPSGSGRRMDDKWIELMEYTDEIIDFLTKESAEILDELKTVSGAIRALPRRESAVLAARYMRGMAFREILKGLPCSERTMYNIHESGLELIDL